MSKKCTAPDREELLSIVIVRGGGEMCAEISDMDRECSPEMLAKIIALLEHSCETMSETMEQMAVNVFGEHLKRPMREMIDEYKQVARMTHDFTATARRL